MRCLSVCQPFADLIVSGRKTIELRRWNTGFRGEFLVHAALRVRSGDAARLGMGGKFVTGAIIGVAEIYGVKPYESDSQRESDSALHLAPGNTSRYGFLLRNAKALRIPIPYRGRLGFFEADLPERRMGREEIQAEIIDEEYRHQWIGRH